MVEVQNNQPKPSKTLAGIIIIKRGYTFYLCDYGEHNIE